MFVSMSWALVSAAVSTVYVLAVCFAVEHVAPIERYTLRQRIPGALMVLAGALLSTGLSWPLQQLWYALGLGFVVVPLWSWVQPLGFAGHVAVILFLVLLLDFLRYWRHRAEHRWFWRIHKVHHSPTELHAANSIGHPLQVVPEFLFVSLPLSLFQFPGIEEPLLVGFLLSFLATYIHSPVDFHFGPFRRVLVDNRFHRIHHSLEERHFDRNFGICFSLWDGMFGTAHWPARGEWPQVGLQDDPPPRTIGEYLKMPFVSGRAAEAQATDAEPRAGMGASS